MTSQYEFQIVHTPDQLKQTYIVGHDGDTKAMDLSQHSNGKLRLEVSYDGNAWGWQAYGWRVFENNIETRQKIVFDEGEWSWWYSAEPGQWWLDRSFTGSALPENKPKICIGKNKASSSLFYSGSIDLFNTWEKKDGEFSWKAYPNITPTEQQSKYISLTLDQCAEMPNLNDYVWDYSNLSVTCKPTLSKLAPATKVFGLIHKLHLDYAKLQAMSSSYGFFFQFADSKWLHDGVITSGVNKEFNWTKRNGRLNYKIPGLAASGNIDVGYFTDDADIYLVMYHDGVQIKVWWRPAENYTLDTLPMPISKDNGWILGTWHSDSTQNWISYQDRLIDQGYSINSLFWNANEPQNHPGSIDLKGCATIRDGKLYPVVADAPLENRPFADLEECAQLYAWSCEDDVMYTYNTDTLATGTYLFPLVGTEGHYYLSQKNIYMYSAGMAIENGFKFNNKNYVRDPSRDSKATAWYQFHRGAHPEVLDYFIMSYYPFVGTTLYIRDASGDIQDSGKIIDGVTNYIASDGSIIVNGDQYSVWATTLNFWTQPVKPVLYSVTVNPTPEDSHVLLRSSLNNVLYQTVEGDGSQTVQCPAGYRVNYQVTKEGYQGISVNMDDVQEDKTINVTINVKTSSFTISATPATASIHMIDLDGEGEVTGTGTATLSNIPYGHQVTWDVSLEGYTSQSGEETVTEDITKNITLETETVTFTITPTPSDATVTINNVVQNSVEVEKGSTVTWSVEKTGYVTQSGEEVVNEDTTKTITLVEEAPAERTEPTTPTDTFYAWINQDNPHGNNWFTLTESPIGEDYLYMSDATANNNYPLGVVSSTGAADRTLNATSIQATIQDGNLVFGTTGTVYTRTPSSDGEYTLFHTWVDDTLYNTYLTLKTIPVDGDVVYGYNTGTGELTNAGTIGNQWDYVEGVGTINHVSGAPTGEGMVEPFTYIWIRSTTIPSS